MSGRYPVQHACARCGVWTASKRDGTPRAHRCLLQWTGEPAPWPIVSDKWLARRVAVDSVMLAGLMNKGTLRGVKLVPEASVGKPNAEARYFFNRDDAERIVAAVSPPD